MNDGRTRVEPPPLPRTRIEPAPLPQTWREDAAGPGTTRLEGEAAGEHYTSSSGRHFELPRALAAGGFAHSERLQSRGAEASLHLVLDAENQPFVLKVYHQGAPKREILERLRSISSRYVNPIYSFDSSPDGFWELQAWVPSGSLRELISREGPQLTPTMVETVTWELASALRELHSYDIEHRDLKPENILVASRHPLQLSLIDFGIASVVDGSLHATSASRTTYYAPPEAFSGMFRKECWDYWSLGIILVELLTGRHPFSGLSEQVVMHRLMTVNPDDFAEGITDRRWNLLCRGLLRRAPEKRWGGEQVERWLRRDATLTVATENAEMQTGMPLSPPLFMGERFSRPEDLAERMTQNWEMAVDLWKNKPQQVEAIKGWLLHTLGSKDIAQRLDAVDRENVNADGTLFRVIRALDPTIPPIFKNAVVDVEGLTECIVRISAEGERSAALSWITALENARILSVADMPDAPPLLRSIDAAWRGEIDAYSRIAVSVSGHMSSASSLELTPVRRAILLGAVLPDSPLLESLKQQARKAATADARASAWFHNLGDPLRANAGSLLLMPLLAAAAASETVAARRARAEATWRFIGQCLKYGSIPALIVAWTIHYNSPAQVTARQEEARQAEIRRQERERARQEEARQAEIRRQEQERTRQQLIWQQQEAERQRQLDEQRRRAQQEDFARRCIRLANGQVQCCPPGQQVRQRLAPYNGGVARFVPYCR